MLGVIETKSIIAESQSKELIMVDTETRNIHAEEIRVSIKATALNRADLLQRAGLYPPPPGETEVLGLEMSGIVKEIGENVQNFAPGDRVFSLLSGGGYAEEVIIHQRMAMKIPEHFTFEEAASIPEAYLTAYMNLKWLVNLQLGETILIHAGASGVGTAAIQIAKKLGATVIVTAGSFDKCIKCQELGADYTINYKDEDFSLRIQEICPNGVNAILDFVGASYWKKNLQVIGYGGRWVLLGLLGQSVIQEVDLTLLLKKNVHFIGSTLRSKSPEKKQNLTTEFYSFAQDLFISGEFKTIVDQVYSWKEVNVAYKYMEENKNIGKIVLRID